MAHIGDGYIYGAKGQICSEKFREQQAKQYPAHRSLILGAGGQWDGRQVWDCAQLTRAACRCGGAELVSGATSQWKQQNVWAKKGPIATLPAEVCCLFREHGGRMQHTGLYLGDRTFVHAKGTRSGVLRQALGTYQWTHWALPCWSAPLEPDADAAEAPVLYRARVKDGRLWLRQWHAITEPRIVLMP